MSLNTSRISSGSPHDVFFGEVRSVERVSPPPGRIRWGKTTLFLKRFLDILLSGIALVLLAPLFLLIALPIKLDSTGPVIYKQLRVGRGGRLFQIYKFRTMYQDTPDIPTQLMLGRPSPVTRVGRVLRCTSLDEIPQLVNVLIGDMSLVGPRPALHNEDFLICERDGFGLNSLKPGLTGWAQINGRDELDFRGKVRFDKWYMDNHSLVLDFTIMFKTIPYILSRRGTN